MIFLYFSILSFVYTMLQILADRRYWKRPPPHQKYHHKRTPPWCDERWRLR